MARKKKNVEANVAPVYKVKIKDGHTGIILNNKALFAQDGYVYCSAEEAEQLKAMEVVG